MKHPFILAGLLALISHRPVFAGLKPMSDDCPCGYSVNATDELHFGLFTDYFETDFFHLKEVGVSAESWRPQVHNVSAEEMQGTYGISKQVGNIIPNPLPERTWKGPAASPGDAGLQLWVRSELEAGIVPSAQIAGPRNDMLYGSFRAAIKFTGVNGTSGAFHWYHNRTQQIRMQFRSSQKSMVHYDVFTSDSKEQDPSVMPLGTDRAYGTILDLPQEYHEYRFDWMPDRVDFYIDGLPIGTWSDAIPRSPGFVMLSHWSNGDPDVSDGPPMQDAVMAVGYVKAYFNTTTRDVPSPGCPISVNTTDPFAYCEVLSQVTPPNPNGNATFFFSEPAEHLDDDGGNLISRLIDPTGELKKFLDDLDDMNITDMMDDVNDPNVTDITAKDDKEKPMDTTFVASGSNPRLKNSAATSSVSSLIGYFIGVVSCVVYCLT